MNLIYAVGSRGHNLMGVNSRVEVDFLHGVENSVTELLQDDLPGVAGSPVEAADVRWYVSALTRDSELLQVHRLVPPLPDVR